MLRLAVKLWLALVVTTWPSYFAHGGELVPINTIPSWEDALLRDAADGTLNQFSLLDAAIVAGGAHEEPQLLRMQQRLRALWNEVGEQSLTALSVQHRPQAIFAAMHRLLLTGKYDPECTEPHKTIETGDFNCVTATVLYIELCRRHGIAIEPVAIPGHVYCRFSPEQTADVQTTCRDWFTIRSGQLNTPSAIALLKQLENRRHEARPLSDIQLLGKVYYNRGVSLLEQQDFSGAVQLLNTSVLLDAHDEPARNNLLAAYNNWSLALCDKQDYAAAIKKLSHAREINPQYGPLLTNDLHVHQKWVLHLCDQERYASAIELLEAGYQRRPEAPLFSAGRYAVYGMWMKSLLQAQRLTQALSVADMARKTEGDKEEMLRQELAAFQAAAEQVVAEGKLAQAKNMLEIGLQRHPSAESLRVLLSRLQ